MAMEWDDHMLVSTAVGTVVLQLLCFFIAYTCSFDLITDFAGSINFVLLAVFTLLANDLYTETQVVMTVCLCVTRFELALFLLYRVVTRKKDDRFDEVRNNFFAFLGFWIFQMLWVWLVSLPVVIVNSDEGAAVHDDLGVWGYAGLAVFIIGFLTQTTSDIQKYRFRSNIDNKGKICDVGLWSWSRHPNYFGEIAMWGGITAMGVPVYREWDEGWIALLSPAFTIIILLFGTGIPTAEGKNLKRYYESPESAERYTLYRDRTSPVIPMPPAVYAALPSCLQQLCFCEFKMYAYMPKDQPSGGPVGGHEHYGEAPDHHGYTGSHASP